MNINEIVWPDPKVEKVKVEKVAKVPRMMKTYRDAATKTLLTSVLNKKFFSFIIITFLLTVLYASCSVLEKGITNINSGNFVFSLFLLVALCGGLYFLFKSLQKGIFKIETSSKGISFIGFMKRNELLWEDINSIEVGKSLHDEGKAIVKTNRGILKFALTMKEDGNEFPQLSSDFKHGTCWIDEKYQTYPITSDHCILYQEIEYHLLVNSKMT